ncbi:hypothetical protein [Paraburkholderia sprentiae]|uniref:Uncharacterized protein n=1 Tax=Paraburkholderia sprentiae WSM5005 TaxID=754502 RepID=A0A1I9YSD1_9BURK|nr:hypothetical protein [Paraburkholderia sprentiae]
MLSNLSGFQIDATPRRADGEYIAHARISCRLANGRESDVHMSGDLAGFDSREDAVQFARHWAIAWLEEHYGQAAMSRIDDPSRCNLKTTPR